jgi:membrane glycosyltransferase
LRELRDDETLLAAHLRNCAGMRRRNRGEVDPHLAIARARIEDAESFDEAVGYLTPRETFAVLTTPEVLGALLRLPPAGPAEEAAG